MEITERKSVDQDLRESQRLMEEAQHVACLGSWKCDCVTGEVTWSKELFALMNRDPAQGEPDVATMLTLFHPDDAHRLEACTEKALREGIGYTLDLRRATPEGVQPRWFHHIGMPLFDSNGKVVQIVGTMMDITERKQAEERLQENTERLRFATESSEMAVWEYDVQSGDLTWDDRMLELYEYTRENFPGAPEAWKTRVPAEDQAACETALWETIDGLRKFDTEFRIALPNRRVRIIKANAIVLKDQNGMPVRVVGINQDITLRKQALDEIIAAREASDAARIALEDTNRELSASIERAVSLSTDAARENRAKQALLLSIPSILISVDPSHMVTHWSKAAAETLSLRDEDVAGLSFWACSIPWNWSCIEQGVQECQKRRGPVRLDEVQFTKPDKTEGILALTITPVFNSEEQPDSFLILGADITERRHLQTMLSHAQKLESIGQMAAGIAHEINTPIQYVSDNLRFLSDAFGDMERLFAAYANFLNAAKQAEILPDLVDRVEKVMDEIDLDYLRSEAPQALLQSLDGTRRVAQIVGAMKEFSHPGTTEKTAIDLNRAIESTVTVARNEYKYVANVVFDLADDLPLVPCLPGDLNQVILNIVVNAAHAIRDVSGESGALGTITIRTFQIGNAVEIQIADTGQGIPEGYRNQVFNPFFTTKEVGRGTGQGLAIAHAIIVEKHRGTIRFETEMGRGTTFMIRLPLSDEAQAA